MDVIDEYDGVLGMLINWEKTLAICTDEAPRCFLGSYLWLKFCSREKKGKYLGMEHGPTAEDTGFHEQLVEKLKKKCAMAAEITAIQRIIRNFYGERQPIPADMGPRSAGPRTHGPINLAGTPGALLLRQYSPPR